MEDQIYEDIFNEFLDMCPEVRGKVVKWYGGDEYEIIAILRDGSAYLYDSIYKTSRRASTVDALFRKPRNEEEWRREFSKRLHRKMRLNRMTQDELAWRADVSTGSMANYMNGYSTPTAYKLIQIADALGCSVNDLVYF